MDERLFSGTSGGSQTLVRNSLPSLPPSSMQKLREESQKRGIRGNLNQAAV